MDDLEAANRQLAEENKRLRVERVRGGKGVEEEQPVGYLLSPLTAPAAGKLLPFLNCSVSAAAPPTQDNARDDARDATEKMVVAQAQRARLLQRVQELSPEVAAQAREAAEALAGGTSSEGDVIRGQLERIAELECEVKRLKQVSRCAPFSCMACL